MQLTKKLKLKIDKYFDSKTPEEIYDILTSYGLKWHDFSIEKPPIGTEVIAYHHKWINEDFNPSGQRVGFLTDDGDFISAYWWDTQDDYIGLSHRSCDANEGFDHNSDNIKYIEPEWWMEIPKFPC